MPWVRVYVCLKPMSAAVFSRGPYRGRVARTRDTDACPGALQVHQAADGALARVRLPGGMLTAAQLAALSAAATQSGSGTLELTARGNVQLRGLTDVTAVAETLAAAGLLPSTTHERVRNIVASPLSGRAGGDVDVRGWVGDLDAATCAAPRLADLGGRFWFSLDDGRADVSGLRADIGVHASPDGCALLLAGRDTGVRLAPARCWRRSSLSRRASSRSAKPPGASRNWLTSVGYYPTPSRVGHLFPSSPRRRWAGSVRMTAG